MSQQPACPHCASVETVFKKKAGRWECNDCESRFDLADEAVSRPQRIFLSYGHDDNTPLVLSLHERLSAAGHQVWIDQSQIKVGDDWRLAIKKGLLESDRVLSFLSKHSTRDPGVCLDEIGIALAHRHGAIATLLVEPMGEVFPPPSISHIQYLDLSKWRDEFAKGDAHWSVWLDKQASKVLEVVKGNAGFSGEMDELQRLLLPLSHGGRIGSLVERGFVGRSWLLKDIEDWRLNGGARTFWLMAEPGMGKSAVAAHLVHTTARFTIGYHFCRFDEPGTRSPETFVCSIAFQIAARLPGFRTLLLYAARYPSKPLVELQADDLFTLLLANPLRYSIDGGQSEDRLMVIVDALDEAPAIAELLARRQNELPAWLALMVTSRPDANIKSTLAGIPAHALNTNDPRNQGDLEIYIDQWFAAITPQPVTEVRAGLLERSEGNILYLVTARAGVANHVFSLDDPSTYPQGLGGLYRQWFDRQFGGAHNEADWSACYALLELICASPEPLPIGIARRNLGWVGQDRVRATRPMGSLLHGDGDALELFHRSLAEWLQDAVMADRYWVNVDDGRVRLAATLWGMLPEIVSAGPIGYTQRVLPGLLWSIPSERRTEVWGSEDGRFELLDQLDKTLAVINEYKIQFTRIDLAKIRIEEYKNHFGLKATNTLEAMGILATLLCEIKCDFKNAQKIFEFIINTHEEENISNVGGLLKSRSCLAKIYYLIGDLKSAQNQYELISEQNIIIYGEIHSETAKGLSNLAQCLASMGNHTEALKLNEKVLFIREIIFGSSHVDVAESLHQIAQNFDIQCNPVVARPLLERAMQIREKILGADHPKTADSILALADIINLQGNNDTYETLIRRALTIREKASGPEHPETAKILARFASQAEKGGDVVQSIQLFKQILEVHEKIYGHNHLETLHWLNILASAYIKSGDCINGKKFYEQANSIAEFLLNEDAWIMVTRMFTDLGSSLFHQGMINEGEILSQRAIDISSRHLFSDGSATFVKLDASKGYAQSLEESNRFKEAISLFRTYLDGLGKAIGKGNEVYLTDAQNFAVLLRKENLIDEAESIQRNVLINRSQLHGNDSLEVASALSALGAILQNKGNKVEATNCLCRALSIRETRLGSNHESTQLVRNRLEELINMASALDENYR